VIAGVELKAPGALFRSGYLPDQRRQGYRRLL